MTPDPACCLMDTPIDQVARMMIQHDCGEIPVIDNFNRPIGVVTDRDIVYRVVAEAKNPIGHTAAIAMTRPVVTVATDATLDDVIDTMTSHQIRRVLVVDGGGCCAGIIAQADIATAGSPQKTGDLVQGVSQDRHVADRIQP
jgi:CBS domain-containing protein